MIKKTLQVHGLSHGSERRQVATGQMLCIPRGHLKTTGGSKVKVRRAEAGETDPCSGQIGRDET